MAPEPGKPSALADAAAAADADAADACGRAWWARVPRVLTAPRAVFEDMRATDEIDLDARGEPITAIVILAGMVAVLLSPRWGRLLDDPAVDGLVVAVLTFIAGCFYAAVGLFLLGLAVWFGARGAGSETSFRLARHLVGFSALPLALSLFVIVPLTLVWFGGDWFHEGGSDDGTGRWLVTAIGVVAMTWSLGLLVVGLRTTLRLSWFGVATALGLAGVIVAGLAVVPSVLG